MANIVADTKAKAESFKQCDCTCYPPLPPPPLLATPLAAAAVVVVLDVAQTPLTLCSRPDRPEIYEFGYPVASDLALPVATACSE